MLTDQEKEEIDKEIAKFPHKHNACLDALMSVQRHRGYISDDTLVAVADYLAMSATELDGIASFYNLIFRRPVGKSVIRLCDSVSCWIMGYRKIVEEIKNELNIGFGETSADEKFTLLPAQCLGVCDKAPAMMINERLYTNLNGETLKEILMQESVGSGHDATSYGTDEKRRPGSKSKGFPVGSGV